MDNQPTNRTFDLSWSETASLKDGTAVIFRLIRPEDKGLLVDGLHRMSPESRFRRFFSHRDHLSPTELAYLTELDHDRHFALGAGTVATPEAPSRGLGVARFVRLEEPTLAEAAVAVVDEAQGQGLGRMLFERMVKAASERGVKIFRFEVLAENDSMLGLIDKLFPGSSRHVEDGILTLDCPLPDLSTHVEGESIGGSLYAVLRHAAEGTLRVLRARGWRSPSSVLKGSDGASTPQTHHKLSELIGLQDDDVPGL
ncbi:MAG TPA: GNAT family N-acetyltransferase [Myxococcota bacterium]|nr:GNAT family N-acetyltransferase [Myxococcota bacterium]